MIPGNPLAGLIVGSDSAGHSKLEAESAMRADSVPVFVVLKLPIREENQKI